MTVTNRLSEVTPSKRGSVGLGCGQRTAFQRRPVPWLSHHASIANFLHGAQGGMINSGTAERSGGAGILRYFLTMALLQSNTLKGGLSLERQTQLIFRPDFQRACVGRCRKQRQVSCPCLQVCTPHRNHRVSRRRTPHSNPLDIRVPCRTPSQKNLSSDLYIPSYLQHIEGMRMR